MHTYQTVAATGLYALAKSLRKYIVSSFGLTAFLISIILVLDVFLGVEYTIGKRGLMNNSFIGSLTFIIT